MTHFALNSKFFSKLLSLYHWFRGGIINLKKAFHTSKLICVSKKIYFRDEVRQKSDKFIFWVEWKIAVVCLGFCWNLSWLVIFIYFLVMWINKGVRTIFKIEFFNLKCGIWFVVFDLFVKMGFLKGNYRFVDVNIIFYKPQTS